MASVNPKFAIGATVSLKSGGPVMTVHSAPEGSAKLYVCQWFAGKKLERGTFKEDELVAADPKAPLPAVAAEAKR